MLPRCEEHGKPNGKKYEYVAVAEPIGYPETAIRCGHGNCTRPALAYLDQDDYEDYLSKKDILSLPDRVNFRVKIQLDTVNIIKGANVPKSEDAMDW